MPHDRYNVREEALLLRARSSVLHYLGVVLVAFSVLQAAPLIASAVFVETVRFPMRIYAIPAAIAVGLGVALAVFFRPRALSAGAAMAIGALGWFVLSLVGAIPFWLALDIRYLDAFFETVSGFTTTGVTILTGLQLLPKSLLLWRGMTQWIGGLGIFTLFLFVIREGGQRHVLLGAEAHKARAERFSPGVFTSLRILWTVYGGLTIACALILWAERMPLFDAVVHALTTLSTGGFSTYDAGIAHFAAADVGHAVAIEYTILAFMILGGTSFLVHWGVIRRRWQTVWRNAELRAWLLLLLGASVLVLFGDRGRIGEIGLHRHVRESLFHVVSIATTTGFTIRELASPWFSPLTMQVFFLLMIIGGCVASTAGGLKVQRVAVLGRLFRRQLRASSRSARESNPLTFDGRILAPMEVERTVAIAVAWLVSIVFVWTATLLLSDLGAWESLSASASAVGNLGPSAVGTAALRSLGPGVKLCYILAMIAGRLEILPFLLIFSRRVWR
jgi:trk system potassium uptake protein TrkH